MNGGIDDVWPPTVERPSPIADAEDSFQVNGENVVTIVTVNRNEKDPVSYGRLIVDVGTNNPEQDIVVLVIDHVKTKSGDRWKVTAIPAGEDGSVEGGPSSTFDFFVRKMK